MAIMFYVRCAGRSHRTRDHFCSHRIILSMRIRYAWSVWKNRRISPLPWTVARGPL